MKYTIYLGIALFILVSCNNKGENKTLDEIIATKNIELIKSKQQELEIKYNKINSDLIKVSKAITKLSGKHNLPLVTTDTIKSSFFQHKTTVQGNVDTRKNTMLFSQFSGRLKGLYVTEGQRVNKGDLIAEIDDSGISQQLAQIEIQYNLAKTTFERQQRLWDKKIGSEIQYLQAKTQKEALEKNIKQIKAQLDKTKIYAPYSGSLDDIPVKRGAMVLAGQTPIARLINLSNMYIRANISETYLGLITKGTNTEINFPAINKSMTGKVQKVGNFINPNNRTFFIEINIPNPSKLIKPNLMAVLEMADYTNKKAIVIPENIIRENAQGDSFIYIVIKKDNKYIAKKQPITKGLTQGYYTEIKAGLKLGDIIVNGGSGNMQDNMEIKIVKKTN